MTDTTTEAPASTDTEATEKVDHEAVLSKAFVAFSNRLNDEGGFDPEVLAEVHEAYRAVPTAARGKAQGAALRAVLTEGNGAALEPLLQAVTDLPKAPTSRRSAPSVDPKLAASLQIAGLLVAYSAASGDGEVGAEASATAQEWFANGCPDEHRDSILRIATKALNASTARRGGGSRESFRESVADLIARGAIEAGTKLVGPNDAKATVTKDGKIKVGNAAASDSPTAAARVAKGDDKASINGWDFWTLPNPDGEGMVTLGSLRAS